VSDDADDELPPPEPDERRPLTRKRLSILWRIAALVRPHTGRLVIALITLMLASGLSLVYPAAAKYAVDAGLSKQSAHDLDRVVLLLCVVFVVHAVLVWVRHYSMSWLGERVVADLRALVFDRILRLPLAWFHERRTGELVGRLASDVTVVEGVVGSELSLTLRNAVQLIGGLVLLFVTSVELTLYMLAVIPPIVVGTIVFGRAIRRMSKRVQDGLATVSGHVQEAVGAIQTVQAFVRERHEAARYRAGVEDAFQRSLSLVRWRASFFASATTAGYIAIAAVVWLGGRAMIRGEISAGRADLVLPLHLHRRRRPGRARQPVGRAPARGRRDRAAVRDHRHRAGDPRSRGADRAAGRRRGDPPSPRSTSRTRRGPSIRSCAAST
jgi:ABC-type multidrug transport system fused ATPase/permease subunit